MYARFSSVLLTEIIVTFQMFDAPSVKGQIVTGHCPVMFNIVLPSVVDDMSNPMIVGLTGCGMRDKSDFNKQILFCFSRVLYMHY